MKKYTYYRVSLLVGLLSFNILSSCVNTARQELGCLGSCYNKTLKCLYTNQTSLYRGLVAALVLGAGGLIAWPFIAHSGSQSNVTPFPNHPNATTREPLTSTDGPSSTTPFNNGTDKIDELTTTVTKAIEEGDEKWGKPSTTTEGPSTTAPPTERSSTTTTSTTTSTTTEKSDDGVSPVENSMVLDSNIIEDLKQHKLSKESAKQWFDAGLNPDATDENGQTLLIWAINSKDQDDLQSVDNEPVIKFIIEQGANVNLKGQYGTLPLLEAVHQVEQGHIGENTIYLLLDRDANPCIGTINSPDVTAFSYVERIYKASSDANSSMGRILEKMKKVIKYLYPNDERCPA